MNREVAEGQESSEDGQRKESEDEQKVIPPPDVKRFEKEHAKLQNAIREKEASFKALPRFPLQTAGFTVSRDKDSLLNELKELKARREKDIESRKQYDQELRTLNTQVSNKNDACSKLQAGLRYRTERPIDELVRRLEHQINAQQLTLKEEKRIVSEIDALKRSKKSLHEFLALKQVIIKLRERQAFLRNQRDDCVKRINASKSREEKINTAIDAVEQMGDIQVVDQTNDRESLRAEIDHLYSEKRELVAAFHKERTDYHSAQAELRAQAKARRKELAAAKKAEERAAHSRLEKSYSDRSSKERRLPRDPHEKEKAACAHLIAYMERLQSSNTPGVHAAEGTVAGAEVEHLPVADSAGDGMFLRRKSTNDELVGLYGGLGPKLSRKGSKKGRRSSSKEAPRKLTLHPAVVEQLLSLNLSPPSTMADIPKLLEELHAKKAMLDESPPSEERSQNSGLPAAQMSLITEEVPSLSAKKENSVTGSAERSGGEQDTSKDPRRPENEGSDVGKGESSSRSGEIATQPNSGPSDLPSSTVGSVGVSEKVGGVTGGANEKTSDLCEDSVGIEQSGENDERNTLLRRGKEATSTYRGELAQEKLAKDSDAVEEASVSRGSRLPENINISKLKERLVNQTEERGADAVLSGETLLENGRESEEHLLGSKAVDSGTSSKSRLPPCDNSSESVAMGDSFRPEPPVNIPCAEKCVA